MGKYSTILLFSLPFAHFAAARSTLDPIVDAQLPVKVGEVVVWSSGDCYGDVVDHFDIHADRCHSLKPGGAAYKVLGVSKTIAIREYKRDSVCKKDPGFFDAKVIAHEGGKNCFKVHQKEENGDGLRFVMHVLNPEIVS